MNRRQFLKRIAAGSGVLMLSPAGCVSRFNKPENSSPNIVVILADDLGYGDVSCNNKDSKVKTKHIDKLARVGMRFTDAHTPSAVCTPTRYGLLTGRYCWRTRLKRGVLNGYSRHLVEDGRKTVASLLKEQGYETYCTGKWHLGMDWQKTNVKWDYRKPILNGPTTFGFDHFYGFSASLDMPPYCWIEDDKVTEIPAEKLKASTYPKYWRAGDKAKGFEIEKVLGDVSQKAAGWIRGHGSQKPFFMYVPLPSPHKPVIPGKKFIGQSEAGVYGDYVAQTDWAVGEIVKALQDKGVFDNTLLIVTSDNGSFANVPQYGVIQTGHAPNYLFRGGKTDIHEGGHRVPFIATWPRRIKAGTVSDEVVILTDIMATCGAAAGVEMPDDAGEDSVNILPALTGKVVKGSLREGTVFHSISGMFALRQGKWKLVFGRGAGGRGGKGKPSDPPGQLYDMSVDPYEKNNVFEKHPEIVREMTELMDNYVKRGRSTPGIEQEYVKPVKYLPGDFPVKKLGCRSQ